MAHSFSLEEINQMSAYKFVDTFGCILERSPLIIAAVAAKRPFHSIRHFHGCIIDVISRLASDAKEGLVMVYPDLESTLKYVSNSSREEEESSSLQNLPSLQLDLLKRLNCVYRARNSFPFILCMKEHKASDVFDHLEMRLKKHREMSLETSLSEICKIIWYRLCDLCKVDESISLGPVLCSKL